MDVPLKNEKFWTFFITRKFFYVIFGGKNVFFKTVYLGKSRNSESNGPSFEKWKILNISHHPEFFLSVFWGKKCIFQDSVSRQIKKFWIEWTPLWKMKNFEHFSSPETFFEVFFGEKNVFFKTVFLGKSRNSESNGPSFEKWKILNISHQKFFKFLLGKNMYFSWQYF